MWSAKLENKTREKNVLKVVVSFSNGTPEDSFTKEFATNVGGINWLKQQVKREIDSLEAIESNLSEFSEGSIDTTVSESAEEIAKIQYREDLMTYSRMLSGVELGIFDGTEKKITDMKAKIKDSFIPDYLNLL